MASAAPEPALDIGMGPVVLRVRDLERVRRFYEDALGLVPAAAEAAVPLPPGTDAPEDELTLTAPQENMPLIHLLAAPDAPRRPPRSTGLYHLAIRVPDRPSLARFLRHILNQGVNLQGLSDHGVSEAIYLMDPERNGIEVYADRPHEDWPMRDGNLSMTTQRLDIDSLMETAAETAPVPRGTDMGHVHLQVGSLDAGQDFYCGSLGLELMQRYGDSAIFVAAGGYHHHIGLNTWAGQGAPPPPSGAMGLVAFGIQVAGSDTLSRLQERLEEQGVAHQQQDGRLWLNDPSENRLWLSVR